MVAIESWCDECEQQGAMNAQTQNYNNAMNANDRNRDRCGRQQNGNLYSPHGGNGQAQCMIEK